jgi:hypothetical protein
MHACPIASWVDIIELNPLQLLQLQETHLHWNVGYKPSTQTRSTGVLSVNPDSHKSKCWVLASHHAAKITYFVVHGRNDPTERRGQSRNLPRDSKSMGLTTPSPRSL